MENSKSQSSISRERELEIIDFIDRMNPIYQKAWAGNKNGRLDGSWIYSLSDPNGVTSNLEEFIIVYKDVIDYINYCLNNWLNKLEQKYNSYIEAYRNSKVKNELALPPDFEDFKFFYVLFCQKILGYKLLEMCNRELTPNDFVIYDSFHNFKMYENLNNDEAILKATENWKIEKYNLKVPDNKKIDNIMSTKSKGEVFVTYSWDSEEHNLQVLSFVNHLRGKTFYVEMDKSMTQKESALDFHKMMHQIFTHYEKVIIVLSEGYKQKADNFIGGVGNEYSLLIKDIGNNPNKYILVSFEPVNNNIAPLALQGRHTLDVSIEKEMEELYAKLLNIPTIQFAEVGTEKPRIDPKEIPEFKFESREIKIINLKAELPVSFKIRGLFENIAFSLFVEIINDTGNTIEDYQIEVSYPFHLVDITFGTLDNKRKVETFSGMEKIYAKQTKRIEIGGIQLFANNNLNSILTDKIDIKIFSSVGSAEKSFSISELTGLTVEMFNK